MSRLVVILGPTASGKSALALKAAQPMGGEIVNCDSMQMYRGLSIGTAKPTVEERLSVRHHLFDILDPDEFYSAGRYMDEARRVCREVSAREGIPVVVGGTGLYLRALLEGVFEGPSAHHDLRRRLRRSARRFGKGHLHRLLARLDPEAAATIQPADQIRLIRAIEVCLISGAPFSKVKKERTPLRGVEVLKVGIDLPRQELYQRINRRVAAMFERGLAEEVRSLMQSGYGPESKGFEALGYRPVASYLGGEMSREEALRQTQQDSRRYAKRQMTWFRREEGVRWLHCAGEDARAFKQFKGLLKEFAPGRIKG
ncbi:MAG: tRNA (adenosine(37)-N6)-dimethylallyltransferase MiaA [Acidobacteriota bacterium]